MHPSSAHSARIRRGSGLFARLLAGCALLALVACNGERIQAHVLKTAKDDSLQYCEQQSKAGCEFSIVKTGEGWTVTVVPVLRDQFGQRSDKPETIRRYSYDDGGQLLNVTGSETPAQ